jgi:enoyl-CoA hydratase/carnithine racemase
MEPYAKPHEKKVGANRPKTSHLPADVDKRTRRERQAEKQAVAAARRAIKKSARQHLRQELEEEIRNSKLEIRNNNRTPNEE